MQKWKCRTCGTTTTTGGSRPSRGNEGDCDQHLKISYYKQDEPNYSVPRNQRMHNWVEFERYDPEEFRLDTKEERDLLIKFGMAEEPKKKKSLSSFIVDSMKSEEENLLESGMSSQDIAAMKLAEQQEKTKRLEMENNLEMERIKAKQEKVRLKHEKIEKLRAEKKYVSVFILEHPYIFGMACFFALLMLVNIYRNVNKKAFVEMNNKLEKIDGEIIDGINKKKNSKELLDLVAKLNHPNTVDYIRGKKFGIIKSSFGSESDFIGSYSQYWTARREAYKDIIAQGLTFNEYLNKIKKEEMKK
jgi:hypothetical protein